MTADRWGYVLCTSCNGYFHETDVNEDGTCWLCREED